MVRMVHEVLEEIEHVGSRDGAGPVFVGLRPGDKRHDYHLQTCSDCE